MDWANDFITEYQTGEAEGPKVPLQDFDSYYDELEEFIKTN